MSTPGAPLTRQRSPWTISQRGPVFILGVATSTYFRRVHDGQLRSLVSHEPHGWHLSISHSRPNGKPGRYPTWDEIAHARYELLPTDITVAMLLPPPDEYISHHPTTFHLHQIEGPTS